MLRAADAHVITPHADVARQLGIAHVAPELEPLVPVVGQAQRVLALTILQPGRGCDQRADRDRERERTDARVLLPAILRTGRPGARDESDRGAHHVPRARQLGLAELAQLCRQQHRKRRLIQLHADPERLAARKVVLRPAAIAALRRGQVRQDVARIDQLMRRQQRERRERRIARPHQVVAAQVVGAVAPGHAQAGHDRARIGAILVDLEHRRRQQPGITERIVGPRQCRSREPQWSQSCRNSARSASNGAASAVRARVKAP